MTPQLKPSQLMFMLLLILSTMMALMSNSVLLVWISLEINLMVIVPLLAPNSTNAQTETIIKYFMVQTTGSYILILSISMSALNVVSMSLLLLTSLLMKGGGAPCHQWMPPLFMASSLKMLFILATLQKITPLVALSSIIKTYTPTLIMALVLLSSLLGSVGGINQSQAKALLAYSSINTIGWLLASIYVSKEIMLLFLTLYSVNLLVIILLFSKTGLSSSTNLTFSSQLQMNSLTMSCLFMLSLWGSPPFIGFLNKWMALMFLSLKTKLIATILIITSALSLFYYSSLVLMSIILNSAPKKTISQSLTPLSWLLLSGAPILLTL